jgi:tetratricopeptide (TPR) repeat protein
MKKHNAPLLKLTSRFLLLLLLTTIETIDLTIYTANTPVLAQQDNQQKKLEANQLYLAGLEFITAKKFAEAVPVLDRSLILFQELGDRSRQGKINLSLCRAYRGLKELDKALSFCQRSLKFAQELSDKKEIDRALLLTSSVWFDVGIVEFKQGKTNLALESFMTSRKMAEEIDHQGNIGLASIYIGYIYTELADYPAAIGSFGRAIEIYKKLGDSEKITTTILLQGDAYLYSAQYAKALTNYQLGIEASKGLKDKRVEIGALTRLAGTLNSLGQHQQAIQTSKEALVIVRIIGNRSFEATILNGLGSSYISLGEYTQAQLSLEQALVIYRSLEDRYQEQLVLANLAKMYYQIKQYDKSID